MSTTNNRGTLSLKTANASADKLAHHNYAAAASNVSATTPMETSSGPSARRSLNLTPSKLPPAKKQATDPEPSLADIFTAIRSLDNKVEDFGKQLKDNSDMLTTIVQRVESNSVEITECKSKMGMVEKEHSDLKKENAVLKERMLEAERYKRCWNLRLSGLKEKEGENIREKTEKLLLKIFPQWKEEIEDVVDSVHRVGRNEAGRSRQVIMQFVRRRHRDAVWKATKDSPVCKEQGLRFVQDFIQEDRQAREQLWPKIKQARSLGKVAFYRGHIAVIDGQVVKT